uniref:Uncharacterized protein n=1 Tax=Tetranychus urticae TaxID=32264 RepID=T1JUC9_TETUR
MAHLLSAEVDSSVLKIIEAVGSIRRGILDKNQMREAHMRIEALNNSPMWVKPFKLTNFQYDEDLTHCNTLRTSAGRKLFQA